VTKLLPELCVSCLRFLIFFRSDIHTSKPDAFMCVTCEKRGELRRMRKMHGEVVSCLYTYTVRYSSFPLLQEHMKDGYCILLSPYQINFESILN